MKINTSPNDITTYQLSHSDAVYLGILVHVLNRSLCGPNNILLNVLCHFIVFSLCEFPANISTPIVSHYNYYDLSTQGSI